MLKSTILSGSSILTATAENTNNASIAAEGITKAAPEENAAKFTLQQNSAVVKNEQNDDRMELDKTIKSPAPVQLAAGILQIFEPQMLKARGQLKELISKQNKVYIDLSAQKYKLDNADVALLYEMMNQVRIYREKIIKIKKRMENIYQRTKVLKKRAANIQASKQKELQRKLQKQHLEESLIAKQQQLQQQQHQQQISGGVHLPDATLLKKQQQQKQQETQTEGGNSV